NLFFFFIFFFSSRRRHTRLQGDWSSDVCSSDLSRNSSHRRNTSFRRIPRCESSLTSSASARATCRDGTRSPSAGTTSAKRGRRRSEERRVGKEGRSGGWAEQ